MGAQLGGSGGFSDINMTPLIDIVLVVLIIMMVNIPISVNRLGVKLPGNGPPPETMVTPDLEQLAIAVYEELGIEMPRRRRNLSLLVPLDGLPQDPGLDGGDLHDIQWFSFFKLQLQQTGEG